MYAILQQGGHQYRVSPGDRLLVDRLPAEIGSVVSLEPIVLMHDGETATFGAGELSGARVSATVVRHPRGTKLRVFKYKPKKRYRRTHGHRSNLTELRVDALLSKGEKPPVATATKAGTADRPPKAAAGERTEQPTAAAAAEKD
ncbi:MAG: 50S ribosomal protein L21 [Candidatus Dormibacteria bacterium]